MYGWASCSILDLMPATRPIGHDNRIRPRLAYGRQQADLGHAHGNVVVLGLVAERASHSAAARTNRFHRKPRHQMQRLFDRRHHIESFLMAMSMQEHAFASG